MSVLISRRIDERMNIGGLNMGVYLPMDMPRYCYDCPLHNGESGYCQFDNGHRGCDERPATCPLGYENKERKEDTLVLGYDVAEGKDNATLIVTRHTGATTKIIKAFFGYDAVKIYEDLTERK